MDRLEALQDKGHRIQALEDRPELRLDLYPIWEGYQELSMSRSVGFAPSGILISEMSAWLDYKGYTDHDVRMEYIRIFRSMDSLTLQHYVEERKTDGKA